MIASPCGLHIVLHPHSALQLADSTRFRSRKRLHRLIGYLKEEMRTVAGGRIDPGIHPGVHHFCTTWLLPSTFLPAYLRGASQGFSRIERLREKFARVVAHTPAMSVLQVKTY
jgi:hypothetical protein